jgi:hypothetical protein
MAPTAKPCIVYHYVLHVVLLNIHTPLYSFTFLSEHYVMALTALAFGPIPSSLRTCFPVNPSSLTQAVTTAFVALDWVATAVSTFASQASASSICIHIARVRQPH